MEGKSPNIIAVGAVAAIILGLVMNFMGNPKMSGAINYLSNGNNTGSQAPATGSSVVGAPSISAQFIDQLLCKYNSPACGTGSSLYSQGQQSNVDPAFAMAVFWNESSFGRAGMAASTRSLGNLRCIPSAACWNGYAAFSSWEDGYQAFYALISGPVYAKSGLTTPEAILPKYAPSGDSNDPSHYISVVNSAMSLWRAGKAEVP